MGVHHKYNLSGYMYQNKEPKLFYSCDKYIVTISDRTYDLDYKHEFDSWEEMRNYIDRISVDPEYEDFSFALVGLVYN